MARWLLLFCAALLLLPAPPVSAQSDELPLVPLEPVKKKKPRRKKRRRRRRPPPPAPEDTRAPDGDDPGAGDDDVLELEPPPALAPLPHEDAGSNVESDSLGNELELEAIPLPESPPEPDPPTALDPAPETRTELSAPRDRSLLYAGYGVLAAGAVAAGAGAFFGLRSERFDGLERGTTGASQAEAGRAFDDSRSAAAWANGSLIAAGALGAAGVGLILYHYVAADEPTLELAPARDGMTLWLRGSF